MSFKIIFPFFLFSIISFFAKGQNEAEIEPVSSKVHTFYYGWYGNPEFDGKYNNWNHPVLPHWRDTAWDNAGSFPGGEDIGANYYPALGCYSSNDPETISQHMELMIQAGIGVFAISWWGKNSFTDKSVFTYLDIAHQYGLKLTFHIEPVYKTIEEFKELVEYISTKYGNHPGLFKHNNKLLYYIYDSHKVKYYDWHKLFDKDGELSIRGTSLDAIFIGHWERERDGGFFIQSGFDGFYTYYASEGFMYGCTSTNWPVLSEFAKQNNLLFIPCVGPGYIDTRIRPWNDKNTERRNSGKYYERMFKNAANVNPDFIGIT
ncbi:MAG: glycoside hydrolase family 99 protein, partial [Draconibacterium sp.]|nr:glycoside hydrolase family 99 protein [Draconibacterium sp.]